MSLGKLRAFIVDASMSKEKSYDLFSLAVSDILKIHNIPSQHILFTDIKDVHSDKNAIWFFLRIFWGVFGTDLKPPAGLKILFNDMRGPGSLRIEAKTDPPVILRQLEEFEIDRYSRLFRGLKWRAFDRGWVDWVFDYNPHNMSAWEGYGIKAVFTPTGFHERFVLDKERRHGISFLGSMRKLRRRIEIVESIESRIHNKVAYPRFPHQRDSILNYSIGLHIHAYEKYSVFPDRRMMLVASNGQTIISERCDWTPFTGDHWVECDREDMPEMCGRALDGEFVDRGRNALSFYRESFRFETHLTRALGIAGVI